MDLLFGATTAPPLPPGLANITQDLAEMRTTCTVCLALSLAAALPIVVTGLVVKERRTFPSRLTTLFLVKIMLMNVVVLLGAGVGYRIPNDINLLLNAASPEPLTIMSAGWCKAQAVSYQFLIWCVMNYWVAIALCLCRVVHSAAEVVDFSTVEQRCYIVIYGTASFFTVVPLIIDQTIGDAKVYRADDSALWCWLTAENSTEHSGAGGGGSAPLATVASFVPWSQVIFFYAFLLLYFGIGITYSIKILSRLCILRRGTSSEVNHTSHIIMDYIVRHSMFILVFLAVLAAVLAFAVNEIIQRQQGQVIPGNFLPLKLHVIVVCSLGTWSFMVFGTSRQICGVWMGWARKCFCCGRGSHLATAQSLTEPLSSTLYTDDNRTTTSSFADTHDGGGGFTMYQ